MGGGSVRVWGSLGSLFAELPVSEHRKSSISDQGGQMNLCSRVRVLLKGRGEKVNK